MNPDSAIEIQNVSKIISMRAHHEKNRGRFGLYKTLKKTVLEGVTLTIRKGEVVGVIGRNGSGKSTLLSIIAKIMEPTCGTITHNGKIATILELGMGFHPDMTGRENIYLKGQLYGFSKKEIDRRVDNIISYSGIGDQIDDPVKTYSSGMSGRLAFAIMANVDSDIMLVDEVLSTGDLAFSAKAKQHFKEVSTSGKTVLFVSHNLDAIESMCTRVIWIEKGSIIKDGAPKSICSEYKNYMENSLDVIEDFAKSGVADAQYKLSRLYMDGTHLKKDINLYEYWLKEAADQAKNK